LLKKHDYAEVINEATFKLSCSDHNLRAGQILQKAYAEALVYYQAEIDRILTGNDSFKWTKTLDIMQKTNELSNEIIYNSAANQLICDPKIYTSELINVRQKAVNELYEAGINSLNQHSKQKAKEAYFYFTEAGKLNKSYKDVGMKIQEAKELATIKIVVEKVPAYSQGKNLFSKKFYQTMLYKLQSNFLNDNFVILYSPEEAKRRELEKPDMIVFVAFIDFQNSQASDFFGSRQVNTNGVIEMKVFSTFENKDILYSRIPGQYIWQSLNSDKGFDLQGLFDSFSLSMCDQVVDRLSLFFKQYN
jgi:hypothetical protein